MVQWLTAWGATSSLSWLLTQVDPLALDLRTITDSKVLKVLMGLRTSQAARAYPSLVAATFWVRTRPLAKKCRSWAASSSWATYTLTISKGVRQLPTNSLSLVSLNCCVSVIIKFCCVGSNARPRFVYDLPKDFPFNDICIEKTLSQGGIGHSSGNKSSNEHVTSGHISSNHDVNPDEVLRTFTNSLHSGGTLGAIHSSLTYYKEALASKEWSNLSPSNAYQNYMFRKNLVGEI